MKEFLGLLALSLAPTIYLAVVIYGKDKYDREPKKILLIAFLWGCFSTVPAGVQEIVLDAFGFAPSKDIMMTLFHAIVVVGFSEELCKFLVLRFHAFRLPEFNEPFDGIVYGAFVALGFATVENLFYVFEYGYGTAIARMFLSVPAHYVFGVMMGYYVGKAKFRKNKRGWFLLKGLLLASLLHGLFDFFIIQENYPGLTIMTVIILFYSWKRSKMAIKELQADSIFRFKDNNLA